MRVVLPAKGDVIAIHRQKAVIRDRDAMGIAGQLLQDMLRPAEGSYLRSRLTAEGRRLVRQALRPDTVGALMRKRFEGMQEFDVRSAGTLRSCAV
jgi:hypothetical protein